MPLAANEMALDIECLADYFLVCYRVGEERPRFLRIVGEDNQLAVSDRIELENQFRDRGTLITFNGARYDMPLLAQAMTGGTAGELRRMSDRLINNDVRIGNGREGTIRRGPPSVYRRHIDVMKLTPNIGLKESGARLHMENIEELPVAPGSSVADDRPLCDRIDRYCANDVELTIGLFDHCRPDLDIRNAFLQFAQTDDRRVPDPAGVFESQLGEWMLHQQAGSGWVRRSETRSYQAATKWKLPQWLQDPHPAIQPLIEKLESHEFHLKPNGRGFRNDVTTSLQLGKHPYKFGMGGIHNTDMKNVCLRSTDERRVVSLDVSSYYPNLIQASEQEPFDGFNKIYGNMIKMRMDAKENKDERRSTALKLALNATFGKLLYLPSPLFNPSLFLDVTITGQLATLDLVMRVEDAGGEMIQTNTDGIFTMIANDRDAAIMDVVSEWEEKTGFMIDREDFQVIAQRDVNNYAAVGMDGSVKDKGAFRTGQKQPLKTTRRAAVVAKAAVAYLQDGTDPHEFVEASDDVRDFVYVMHLKGGGDVQHGPMHIPGSTVRWVRGKEGMPLIRRTQDGRAGKLPMGEHAVMATKLSSVSMDSVDRVSYGEACLDLLHDAGVHEVARLRRQGQMDLFALDL